MKLVRIVYTSYPPLIHSLTFPTEFENENYEELKEAKEFMEFSGFKLVPSIRNNEVCIEKEVDGYRVHVTFEASAPEPEEAQDVEMPEQYQEYEDMLADDVHDFTVVVTKGKSNSGLIGEFTLHGSDLHLMYARYTNDIKVREHN